MRIGFIQMNIRFGDKQANLEKIARILAREDADLFVLPELCTTGYFFASRQQVGEWAESIPGGPTCGILAEVTRRKNCHLAWGMAESADSRIFNSAVLLGPRGHVATYRKVHLFDEEKVWFDAGDGAFAVHDIGLARIGLMICFDWMFPESMRSLALQGAEIVCHPANLVLPYCQKAMVTRCLENGVFAVTANRIGSEDQGGRGLRYTGGSQIIGPRGEVLARASGRSSAVRVVEVDPAAARQKEITRRNHLLRDRRPDLYLFKEF